MLAVYLSLIDEPSDKKRFTEIYEKYKNLMFKVAVSILHSDSLAEEAVQESLFKIAKNFSKFSSTNCIQTRNFIVIIVRNTSINMLKSEHITKNEEFDDDTPDISMDVLGKVISKQGYEFLLNSVYELDDIYSDALTLKLVMGYNNDEISSLLDVSKNTVSSRIYRGKKMLKMKLEAYYGNEMH